MILYLKIDIISQIISNGREEISIFIIYNDFAIEFETSQQHSKSSKLIVGKIYRIQNYLGSDFLQE